MPEPERNDSESPPPRAATPATALVPTPGHLYLIVVGIIVGTLMGPYVLGQIAPDFFHTYISGQADAIRAYHLAADESAEQMQRLLDTGVSVEAVTEAQERINLELQVKHQAIQAAEQDHNAWLQTRVHAIWIAVALLMVIESLLGETRPRVAARLSSGRYALIAVWHRLGTAQHAAADADPVCRAAGGGGRADVPDPIR